MTWIPPGTSPQLALTALISHYHPHPQAKLALALYHHDQLIHTRPLHHEHTIKVGTSRDCDIQLERDAHVDPWQMTLRLDATGWSARDQSSTHGTYINGRRFYDAIPVRPLDELGFGAYVVRLLDESLDPPGPLRVGPPKAQPIYLNIYEQERPLSQHAIQGKTRVTIGRQIESDVQLPGALVSRLHVELLYKQGSWWAKDCGSFNGTLYNRQRLEQPQRLSDGDRLGIGGYELEFKRRPHAPDATPAPPQPTLSASVQPAPKLNPPSLPSAALPPAGSASLKLPYTLKVHAKHMPVRLFRSASPSLLIGRSSQCDIVLDEEYISRQHAQLTLTQVGLAIAPLKEHTKVYIDGKRVLQAQVLRPGERIFIGEHELVLLPNTPTPWCMIPLIDVMVQDPQGQWSRLPFAQPTITIGRMPQCDIELNDVKASRLHASLLVTADRVILRDNQSTNGIEVNDTPVRRERAILPGDIIKIGKHTIQLDRRGSWRPSVANTDIEH